MHALPVEVGAAMGVSILAPAFLRFYDPSRPSPPLSRSKAASSGVWECPGGEIFEPGGERRKGGRREGGREGKEARGEMEEGVPM